MPRARVALQTIYFSVFAGELFFSPDVLAFFAAAAFGRQKSGLAAATASETLLICGENA